MEDKKTKISVLEDDQDTRELVELFFREGGVFEKSDVNFYGNSSDLMERLSGIQIIILDYKLDEGMNGLDVLIKVKERCKKCYTIIVTGQVTESVIIDFLNAKADYFIKKVGSEYFPKMIDAINIAIPIVEDRIKEQNDREVLKQLLETKIQEIDERLKAAEK